MYSYVEKKQILVQKYCMNSKIRKNMFFLEGHFFIGKKVEINQIKKTYVKHIKNHVPRSCLKCHITFAILIFFNFLISYICTSARCISAL